MRFIVNDKLVTYIFNHTTQEDIFAYYLNVSVSEIYYCLDNKANKMNNPLRNDRNPSVGFMYSRGGKLRMKDFADSTYNGDCFDLAAFVLNKDVSDKRDFIYILNHIIKHVVLSEHTVIHRPFKKDAKHSDGADIRYTVRRWNGFDAAYWMKYNLTEDDLTRNRVHAVELAWVNSDRPNYKYNRSDPCYAYELGLYNDVVYTKLYFPFRGKQHAKFITNVNLSIESPYDIHDADVFIMIKSRKDKLVLDKLIDYVPTITERVCVIALSHEAAIIPQPLLTVIRKKAGFGFIFTDFDKQGIICANNNDLAPLFLTNGFMGTNNYKAKDISDYVHKYGFKKAMYLVEDAYLNIKERTSMYVR